MSAEAGAFVQTEVDNRGVATITFAHPASNSLPGHLLRKLTESITAAGNANDIKVVVLRSAGERAFCAGASFDELVAIQNEQEGLDFFSGFAMVINAIRTCPKFVVGRVQGKAVGGGVGLASAVDICYATSYASVKLSELAVGIGPFVVGPAVAPAVVPAGLAVVPLAAPRAVPTASRQAPLRAAVALPLAAGRQRPAQVLWDQGMGDARRRRWRWRRRLGCHWEGGRPSLMELCAR